MKPPAGLLLVCLASVLAGDTLVVLRPAPRSIVNSNSFPLAAQVEAPGDSVLWVEFRVHYYIAGRANEVADYPQIVTNEYLGRDSVPPFEWVWDIQGVLDHHYHEAYVMFIAQTRSGKTIANNAVDFVIDRNPALSPKQVICRRGRPRLAAGLPQDPKAETFANGDNRIAFRPFWDSDSLYLLVSVADQKVITRDVRDKECWLADDIEFLLDIGYARSPIPDSTCYQVVLNPAGAGYLNARQQPPVSLRTVSRQGGYDLLVGIPWKELRVKPRAGRKMGLEVANFDLDLEGGFVAVGTWMDLSRPSFHNPSEWGTLILDKPRGTALPLAVLLLVAALTGGGVLVRRRQKPPPIAQEVSALTRQVVGLVAEEYHREELNLFYVARKMGRNPNYLSSVFRKETGERFNRYLNDVRLREADRLLKTTSRTVAEVALSVGYSSSEYFANLFKKKFGCSPSERRK